MGDVGSDLVSCPAGEFVVGCVEPVGSTVRKIASYLVKIWQAVTF
jgi:hypothetical protein